MSNVQEKSLLGRSREVLESITIDKNERITKAPVLKERTVIYDERYRHLLSPLKLNDTYTLRNRLVCAPMVFSAAVVGNEFGNAEIAEAKYAKLELPAAGGTAMVDVGGLDVNHRESAHLPLPDVDFHARSGMAFNAISEYAWRIRRHGAIALQEFSHAGMMKPNIPGSEIWGPVESMTPDGGHVLAMDEEMMSSVCNDFANGAIFAQEAGFDGVCIHGGHGMLITQFLSARTNTRTDEFGGSLENRAKFPLMILKTIRKYVRKDFLIELRISGREGLPGGMEIDEVAKFLKMCEGIIDCVHISSGIYSGQDESSACAHVVFSEHGYNAEMARTVKAATNIPVGVIGYINSPEQADQLIADGYCDYIVMGRQMLADPDFIHKLEEGRRDEIRQCIGCMHCLEFPDPEQNVPFDGIMPWMKQGNCVINPTAHLHQAVEDLPSPNASRKVVVVGGGPAGIQAAITAAERGHRTVLFEAADHLGGTLRFAETDAVKGDISLLTRAMTVQLYRSGAEVRTKTAATAENIAAENPDAVILAVGGHANRLPIPGIEYALSPMEIYDAPKKIGKKVVMIGGGLVGTEAGLHLARIGHQVTIVEMQMRIAHESCYIYRRQLIDAVYAAGIQSLVYTTCKEIRPDSVVVTNADGEELILHADTVIYALGTVPNPTDTLTAGLRENVKIYKIGDCQKTGQIGDAIRSGFDAAMDIL